MQVVLVDLKPFQHNSLLKCVSQPKIAKKFTDYCGGSRSCKVIDVDIHKKLVTSTCYDQSNKLKQFTKLCKGDMSQNSKTAKMVLGRYYHVLNSRLALRRLAILNT